MKLVIPSTYPNQDPLLYICPEKGEFCVVAQEKEQRCFPSRVLLTVVVGSLPT